MSILADRETLSETLRGVLPDGWTRTLETSPSLTSAMAQIGHPVSIVAHDTRKFLVTLIVTLWASEVDDATHVEQLYTLISPGDGSIIAGLRADAHAWQGVEIRNVGEREDAPGFLAADVEIQFQSSP